MQMDLKNAIYRKNFDITELNKIMSSSLSSTKRRFKNLKFQFETLQPCVCVRAIKHLHNIIKFVQIGLDFQSKLIPVTPQREVFIVLSFYYPATLDNIR